jgi:hypothetical protein
MIRRPAHSTLAPAIRLVPSLSPLATRHSLYAACPEHRGELAGSLATIPILFMHFRTLLHKLATPLKSIASALFPVEWGVGAKNDLKKDFNSVPTVSPLECAVTQNDALTLLECALTKKVGGRGVIFNLQTLQPSNFQTVFIRQSYCAPYPAVPQLATYDAMFFSSPLPGPNDRKQSRFLRCLKRQSGQRVRQVLDAGSGRRSILNGDVGRPEFSPR